MNLRLLAALAASIATVPLALAVDPGEFDDFEDGTVENWVVNLLGFGAHPAPPQNISSGGPAGTDDNYMLLTSLGVEGAGGRMTVINGTQWSGDYLDAGITGIRMDLNNFGDTDLNMRLLFEKVGGFGPTDVAMSDDVFLAAGSGWQSVFFAIEPGDLTALLGTSENALSDATLIRLFHSPTGIFPPEPVLGSLGVDNIQAVPEPGTLVATALGLGALALRRRRAARRSR